MQYIENMKQKEEDKVQLSQEKIHHETESNER